MAQEQRRLAAVMAADVVGYSRLMGRDESGTLARLREHRKQRFEPILARHSGRLVKLTGDGALAEFPSAVEAVVAAITFQQAMADANRDAAADNAIVFRVGVHLGDMIVEGDDLYGDGVNIAARLEGEAPVGGIVISGSIHEAISGRLKAGFKDLGRLTLKNIERRIQAFSVEWEAADWHSSAIREATPVTSLRPLSPAPPPLPDKPSIAVLPFQNLSDDAEQEYFVDGLVEDITTALSRISSFFVIARNSSFTYKGRAVDVRQVGRELGVRYVLEGSVRKAGDRLRISGQLIDAASGSHLWGERYEGVMNDIFDLQDRITSSVVGAIEPKVQAAEIRRAQAKATTDLTAHDLYLRACAAFYDLTESSYARALSLLDRVVAADPQHSSAYGTIAWCCVNHLAVAKDSPDLAARALAAARSALQTGQDNSFALSAAAMALAWFGGDLEEALAYVDRALELNANDAVAWNVAGWVSMLADRDERSIESFTRAIRLSPIDPAAYGRYGGIAYPYFFTGRYDEAIAAADKALNLEPRFSPALMAKIAAAAMAGRQKEVEQASCRLLAAWPDFSISQIRRTFAATGPRRSFLEAALRKAGLPE